MPYPIVTVPRHTSAQLEQLGTKPKFWFRAEDGTLTLFKEGFEGSGEHWAEKLACEVAAALGLPHAHYDLAEFDGRLGVVSPNFVPTAGRLILGNELLAKVFTGYAEKPDYRCPQHTLTRVMAVLRSPQVGPPLDWDCPAAVDGAPGVFVGYLMLDALIGNQDRHHENWGLLKVQDRGLTLAPTFDHASSLGRNEQDEARAERLATRDRGRSVAAYVQRARSGLYKTKNSNKAMTTLEAFSDAAASHASAAGYWRQRLSALDPGTLEAVVRQMPTSAMSQIAGRFAVQVMIENRIRLLASE